MAQWVKRTLAPYVDKLVICDPQRNAWIAKDAFNDDKSSALKLAKLQLDGYIKEIVHPEEEGAKLRSLFLHYYDRNQQLVRFKNKLKAVFRSEAIATSGKGIYEEDAHDAVRSGVGDQVLHQRATDAAPSRCRIDRDRIEARSAGILAKPEQRIACQTLVQFGVKHGGSW